MKERKYKEDYGIESYIDDRGREKRRAVYKGEWFSLADADKKQCRTLPVVSFVIFAAAFLLYIKLSTPSTACMYVLPIASCSLIPLLYWAMGAYSALRSPEKMTRLQKENGIGRVLRSALGCAVCTGMACIGDLCYMLFSLKSGAARELPGFALLAIAAAAAFGCFRYARDAFNRIRKVSPPERKEQA